MASEKSSRSLAVFSVLAVICAGVVIALVSVWLNQYSGGFDWSSPGTRFNFHPLLMITGMLVLNGLAMIMFRSLQCLPMKTVKYGHAFIQALVIIAVVVAMTAVPGEGLALTSLHGWVGFLTLVLFCLQWALGFMAFLFPGLPGAVKAFYRPLHIWQGFALLMTATVSVVAGLTEESFGALDHFSTEYTLVNMTGFMAVVFSGLIYMIIMHPDFKRGVTFKDESIPLNPKASGY